MNSRRAWLLLALAAFLPAAHGQTEKWPEKPVRMVVTNPPGGGIDKIARVLAAQLSEQFGQQFLVDNHGGAGGTIGAEMVARANPDGYTLAVVPSSFAATPAVYKLSYDPVKGIAPIAMIATFPLIVVVHPSVKAASLKELIELARANPGALNYGTSGVGTSLHIATELFLQMAGIDMVHVPYKGAGPALAAILGGEIQLTFGTEAALLPHIKAGRLREIAVTSTQRSSATPDLPAINEQVPGYSVSFWYGAWAPAGTPREIVLRLNQALARILKQPKVQASLRADGLELAHSTPEEFAAVIARDVAMWSNVVKTRNIKLD